MAPGRLLVFQSPGAYAAATITETSCLLDTLTSSQNSTFQPVAPRPHQGTRTGHLPSGRSTSTPRTGADARVETANGTPFNLTDYHVQAPLRVCLLVITKKSHASSQNVTRFARQHISCCPERTNTRAPFLRLRAPYPHADRPVLDWKAGSHHYGPAR